MSCYLTQKQAVCYSVEGVDVQRLEVVSQKFIGFKEKVFTINNSNPIYNAEPFSGCLERDLMSKDIFYIH